MSKASFSTIRDIFSTLFRVCNTNFAIVKVCNKRNNNLKY